MNLSNKITISRILIMPFFMMSLDYSGVFWKVIAMLLFAYACYSDWLDGSLARKHSWVTDFGKFLDPLADKIFVCAAFIAFVGDNIFDIPAWIVTLIIFREFMITGLRTLAVSKNIVLSAQAIGKYKTVIQLFTIGAIILISLLYELEKAGALVINKWFYTLFGYTPIVLMAITAIVTVLSGLHYLWENRRLFR
ncbi:MAG: CDP-diacylglycerol--glycerol-3-phosphate 3-phosphatidyltransferase [bacterium]|nr:CDP-diacylglycerol--glycerol-3-phosphate 3-phosphatidyltransferase [bacterium]